MRKFDFHFHCNSGDPAHIGAVLETCKKFDVVLALSGGLRYGAHDYLPNEEVLEICRKNPDWFVPLARFDLWEQVDADQIRRWKEAGFRGVKFIYPYYPYDDDRYMPVYEACEECDLPVLFHTGVFRPSEADVKWKRPMLKNMNPVNLDRIARSFQKLHIVMAHMGTSFFRQQAAGLVAMHANLFTDLAGCGSWMGVSPEELGRLFRPFPPLFRGAEQDRNFRKLVFGSDGYMANPWPLTEGIGYYERSLELNAVPEDIRNGIMGGTVAAWMGVEL